MCPTNSEFNRVTFSGISNGGQVPDQYNRVDTAQNSDASASLSSSTWKGDDFKPENLLQSQADAVQAAIDAKLNFNSAYGLEQPVASPGSHGWLRDEREHMNQEPDGEAGVPEFRDK